MMRTVEDGATKDMRNFDKQNVSQLKQALVRQKTLSRNINFMRSLPDSGLKLLTSIAVIEKLIEQRTVNSDGHTARGTHLERNQRQKSAQASISDGSDSILNGLVDKRHDIPVQCQQIDMAEGEHYSIPVTTKTVSPPSLVAEEFITGDVGQSFTGKDSSLVNTRVPPSCKPPRNSSVNSNDGNVDLATYPATFTASENKNNSEAMNVEAVTKLLEGRLTLSQSLKEKRPACMPSSIQENISSTSDHSRDMRIRRSERLLHDTSISDIKNKLPKPPQKRTLKPLQESFHEMMVEANCNQVTMLSLEESFKLQHDQLQRDKELQAERASRLLTERYAYTMKSYDSRETDGYRDIVENDDESAVGEET